MILKQKIAAAMTAAMILFTMPGAAAQAMSNNKSGYGQGKKLTAKTVR